MQDELEVSLCHKQSHMVMVVIYIYIYIYTAFCACAVCFHQTILPIVRAKFKHMPR